MTRSRTPEQQVEAIASLWERWHAAPIGSKQRRALRRAYERAVHNAKKRRHR